MELTENIRLYNMDCMDLLKDTPDKYYSLALVDPPYGIGVSKMAYTQSEGRMAVQKNGSKLNVKKSGYKHGDWDKNTPNIEYFIELKRVSKNQIIWGWNYYGLDWGNGIIKWNKLVPNGVSFNTYEYAFCSLIDTEIEFKYLWAGMCQALSLKYPTTQQGNKKLNEKRIHPTQKPINLYKWLLHNYAKQGDKILDTHAGSFSIGIACDDMGFDLTATELDKDYFEAAVKRFRTYKSQGKLF
jgi:site-specific DNA-methyltransferase (adenine-specific)